MIDIHCHILPDIDDGPETIDKSIEMCRMAASDGIKTIVATPHFKIGTLEPALDKTTELIKKLNKMMQDEGIDLEILSGADVMASPELPIYLRKNLHLTINKTGKYILIEFPHIAPFPNWEKFLLSILQAGAVPIITHPERNEWFINHPEVLYSNIKKGIMVQITAMSLTGGFGTDIQEFSILLLKRNLAHIIATDAHSTSYRPPILSKALMITEDIIGKDKAKMLVTSIPQAVIEGKPVSFSEPSEYTPKKRRWIQRLSFTSAFSR